MAARTNKYTSVNFNDIYHQIFSNNNKPNSNNNNNNNNKSKTIISNSRIQGNMLVLSRPTPKPIPPINDLSSTPPDQPATHLHNISLRPQPPTPSLSPSPPGSAFKTNKFVPPHLRPGFVGKEEKIVALNREIAAPVVHRQGIYGENGRPKSGGGGGGGYERIMRGGGYVGGDVDPSYFMNRPGSSGTRPNTSG